MVGQRFIMSGPKYIPEGMTRRWGNHFLTGQWKNEKQQWENLPKYFPKFYWFVYSSQEKLSKIEIF